MFNRLLLCHAVDHTAIAVEVAHIDADHLAVRVESLKDVPGDGVIRVFVLGDQHRRIGAK